MSLFEDTNPRPLKEMLTQIHSRESALPDFQRDFVWDASATQELIVSIASNYPAGSLLRIRNTRNLFACREVQGAPMLSGHKPTYLVLDGQQRLTSLYQAFYGMGDHRYYLNLKKMLAGNDFEECVFHLRANVKKATEYSDVEVQTREMILPLSVLRNGSGDFFGWIIQASQKAASEAERSQLQSDLLSIQNSWLKVIDGYQFPVVTLSDETSAEAVCTIFETLNRTGVKLSPFELLTARFWPQNINLRALWQKAKDAHPLITTFDIDPYYLLQIVSLASRGVPSCKRGDVLDLEVATIDQWWDRATEGLAQCLNILQEECGIIIPKWLPYSTIVIPMAAVLAKTSGATGAEVGTIRYKMTRWFWCSVFGQSYENAPNSQSAKDVTELIAWIGGGAEPESVSQFAFDSATLRDTTPRQRAVYRGAIALTLSNDARDFHSGQKLTGDLIRQNEVDDHHIFPFAYLGRLPNPPATRLRDCVLNRTLIDSTTNRRISDRDPADYLQEIRNLNPDKFQTLLQSHHLPIEDTSPLFRNDFDAFVQWRQDTLAQQIKAATS